MQTVCLTAKSDMASFVDSLVAPLSIINALVVAIAREKQSELEETFEKLENVGQMFCMFITAEYDRCIVSSIT